MSKLHTIRDLLRDQAQWPGDFEWDFGDEKHCAIGLAMVNEISPDLERDLLNDGMEFADFERIFWLTLYYGGNGTDNISPDDVANMIDLYLVGGFR
jgi:hypothetical protein